MENNTFLDEVNEFNIYNSIENTMINSILYANKRVLPQKYYPKNIKVFPRKYDPIYIKLNGESNKQKKRQYLHKRCFDCKINFVQIRTKRCFKCYKKWREFKKNINALKKLKKCPTCKIKLIKLKSRNCVKCYYLLKQSTMPSRKLLIGHIKRFGYRKSGRIFKVSDNTIRKWEKKL